MTETVFIRVLLYVWLGVAGATAVALLFISAPYGRHRRRGWGPELPARLGWLLMEAPAPLLYLSLFLASPRTAEPVNLIFCVLWLLHYLYRAFVYPFLIRDRGKKMPVAVMGMAVLFNLVNAYTNSRWLNALGPPRDAAWLTDPRFIIGALLFLTGLAIHLRADARLRALRRDDGTDYAIPRGGLFRWVSCPNYLGEIVQWSGWALLTWSLPGLVFAVWTAANLVPRALSHHRWYRETFPDYPPSRRAIFPGVL